MGETRAVKPKRLPLRWRKVRYKVFTRRNVRYELWRGDEQRATLKRDRENEDADRWFWYGCGHNTSWAPKPLEQCKAEAKAAALKWEAEHG